MNQNKKYENLENALTGCSNMIDTKTKVKMLNIFEDWKDTIPSQYREVINRIIQDTEELHAKIS